MGSNPSSTVSSNTFLQSQFYHVYNDNKSAYIAKQSGSHLQSQLLRK
jgi:hypothetical protein